MCTPSASHLEHHGIAAEGKRTQPYVMFFACSHQLKFWKHLIVKLDCSKVSHTLTRTATAFFYFSCQTHIPSA